MPSIPSGFVFLSEDHSLSERRTRTPLGQREERDFRDWFRDYSSRNRLHPNPDHPLHKYNWRGWWVAKERNPVKYAPIVDPVDGWQHAPSEFKDDDHPNRFAGGVDTKTGSKRAKESPADAYNYKQMFEGIVGGPARRGLPGPGAPSPLARLLSLGGPL